MITRQFSVSAEKRHHRQHFFLKTTPCFFSYEFLRLTSIRPGWYSAPDLTLPHSLTQMYQDEGTASTRNAKYVLGGVESSERAHAAAQLPVYDLTDLTVLPDLIYCDQMNSKLTSLHRHQTSYNQTIAHPPPFCFQSPQSPLLPQLHSDQLP